MENTKLLLTSLRCSVLDWFIFWKWEVLVAAKVCVLAQIKSCQRLKCSEYSFEVLFLHMDLSACIETTWELFLYGVMCSRDNCSWNPKGEIDCRYFSFNSRKFINCNKVYWGRETVPSERTGVASEKKYYMSL